MPTRRRPRAGSRRAFATLQDRLVKEMRLAGVKNLEEANRFLEGYCKVHNRRHCAEALEPEDLHRPLPKSVVLDDVLCIQGFRTVNEGYIVKWRGQMYVLGKPSLTLRQQKLVVLERFDGRLSLRFKGRDLEYRQVLAGAQTASSEAGGREDQAKTPEVQPAAEPSLAASDLRERTTLMRPEVFTLQRTGSIHFAFTLPFPSLDKGGRNRIR